MVEKCKLAVKVECFSGVDDGDRECWTERSVCRRYYPVKPYVFCSGEGLDLRCCPHWDARFSVKRESMVIGKALL